MVSILSWSRHVVSHGFCSYCGYAEASFNPLVVEARRQPTACVHPDGTQPSVSILSWSRHVVSQSELPSVGFELEVFQSSRGRGTSSAVHIDVLTLYPRKFQSSRGRGTSSAKTRMSGVMHHTWRFNPLVVEARRQPPKCLPSGPTTYKVFQSSRGRGTSSADR